MSDRAEESIGEIPTLGREETVRTMHSPAWNQDESIGEIPTLGPGGIVDKGRKDSVRAQQEPVWNPDESIGELTTLKPKGIVDDGRTDGARRWKVGEEILGRYVVERELGQGGMGVVYGCLDKVGGVQVAVKGLPPELSHDSAEMEEVRENFRLVGDLRHPCIAGVRTLEKDERGEFYLVMDLAEGESLRKWERGKWKAGGVSLAEAVGVLRQVASALDYAHGRKVVHRDVKPGNVMIDGKGEVKVLDFGLADQIRTSLSRASHAHRGPSGTGPYMSPEQWRGLPQDGKTDQYALGVMAYEMLAGRLPFENSNLGVLREVVLKEEAAAIPGLPAGAMGAIRRAMAKRAEERFGSCGEFVEALVGEHAVGRVGREGMENRPTARAGGGGGKKGLAFAGWGMVLLLAAGVVTGVWWREGRTAGGTLVPRKGEDTQLEAGALPEAGEEAVEQLADQTPKAEEESHSELEGAEMERQDLREVEASDKFAAAKDHVFSDENSDNLVSPESVTASHILIAFSDHDDDTTKALKRKRLEVIRKQILDGADFAEMAAANSDCPSKRNGGNLGQFGRGQMVPSFENAAFSQKPGVVGDIVETPFGYHIIKVTENQTSNVLNVDKEKEPAKGMVKRVDLGGGVTLEMVPCPEVSADFWMGKYEVTQEQWERVMKANPSYYANNPKNPAEMVSWNDCQVFVEKLNTMPGAHASGLVFRLPTEKEWETACRAGAPKSAAYCKLADGTQITEKTLFRVAQLGVGPIQVGSLEPNAWQLYDMHGNVWEWTQSADGNIRIYRGGSFNNSASCSEAGNRNWGLPDSAFRNLGLRLAASGQIATR